MTRYHDIEFSELEINGEVAHGRGIGTVNQGPSNVLGKKA